MSRFRNRDRSNRPGRGQIEHNVLEGLPINQYREIEVTVGPNTTDNKPIDVNAWPELPMPRDSHMLPEHSQQLLRAARSGRTIKPPAPPDEDENEMKDEEPEHKEVSVGFTIKKYVKVARHNEAPEPEYLAKRRKGLPSQYLNGQVLAPLRETKVKKLDAEGNIAVYKVLAPEGQTVEGEVAPTDAAIEVAPVVAVPGTIVEGVGVVNAEGIVVANDILQQTPPRRRPPPPKKKKSKHLHRPGPGRGRKRVDFVEGAEGQGTPAPTASGDIPTIRDLKAGEGESVERSDRDTPMGEAGDEDESGEDGSEDEEQEQEHDQDQDQDQDQNQVDGSAAAPSKAPVAPTSVPVVEMTDAPELAPTESAPLESTLPENASPEISAPTTAALEIVAPETAEPETVEPETAEPEATAHEATALETTVLETTVLETTVLEAAESEPTVPAESHDITESVTSIPAETLQSPQETVQPIPTIVHESEVPPTVPDPSSLSNVPLSAVTGELPTAASTTPATATITTTEDAISEPIASEPVPVPVPSTETESVPASIDISAGEPVDTSVNVLEPEPTEVPAQKEPSVPPSENTPDLLGSLEAELDKE